MYRMSGSGENKLHRLRGVKMCCIVVNVDVL